MKLQRSKSKFDNPDIYICVYVCMHACMYVPQLRIPTKLVLRFAYKKTNAIQRAFVMNIFGVEDKSSSLLC